MIALFLRLCLFLLWVPLAWSEHSPESRESIHIVQEAELSFVPSSVQFVFMDENGLLTTAQGFLREDKNRSRKLREGESGKGHWYAYAPALTGSDFKTAPSPRVAALFYDGGRVGHITTLQELTGEILTLAKASSQELGVEISELRSKVLELRAQRKSVEADYVRTRNDVALIGDLDKIEQAKGEEGRVREAIEQVQGDVQSLSVLVKEAREEEQPKRFHIRERTLRGLMDELVKRQSEGPSTEEGESEEDSHEYGTSDLSSLRNELVELRRTREQLEQR